MVRTELRDAPSYEPVIPVEELARRAGMAVSDVLKLDANENPFGTSAAVMEAVAAVESYAIYPDPAQVTLRAAIGEYVGVPAEQIVVGAGADELIELSMRALVGAGERALSFPPTFGMYSFLAGIHGIPLDAVERRDDFRIDMDAALAAIGEATSLVVVTSPNNPSGTPLTEDELEALLATGVTVLVDEAYAEYAGSSYVGWMAKRARLIVLRTFSKWAGLAGLRVGYGVFPPSVAEALMRVKQPYSINGAAEVAVMAALANRAELDAQAAAVVEERGALFAALTEIPWLEPYPSSANFILCKVEGGQGKALYEALARRGVFVRFYSSERLRGFVRFSVPRPDQHATLVERIIDAHGDL